MSRVANPYRVDSASQGANFNSGDLVLASTQAGLFFLLNASAFGGATLTTTIELKAADGTYTALWTSAAMTVPGFQLAHLVGPLESDTVRVRFTISGGTVTFSAILDAEGEAYQ